MITLQQIQQYKKCRIQNDGDIEAYDRWASRKDKQILSVRQMARIHLIRDGLRWFHNESASLSDEFITAFNHLIANEIPDKKALYTLESIDNKQSLWKRLFQKQ